MRKFITTLLIGVSLINFTSAQTISNLSTDPLSSEVIEPRLIVPYSDSTNTKPFQLSFIYPIGTDWVNSKNNSYNTSLNIIGGITGQTNGVEIGSIFNINKYSTNGVQISGILNITGSDADNSQESNNTQIAGLLNYTRTGNSTQIAGIINRADKSTTQISGITNIANESKCQIGGILNITKKGKFQLGLINIRDTTDGISIGLLNIAKKGGFIELGVEANEFIYGTLILRSGSHKLYGILSIGSDFKNRFNHLWAYGGGLGSVVYSRGKFSINVELTSQNLTSFDVFDANLIQTRPIFNYKISPHFKLYAGPTLNLLVQKPMFSNFIDIYQIDHYIFIPPYSSTYYTNKHKLDFWIGGTIGIKF